jgi:hypothetical protein
MDRIMSDMRLSALILAAALALGAPALAADLDDAPVATAPPPSAAPSAAPAATPSAAVTPAAVTPAAASKPADTSVAAQIDNYLRTSPALSLPREGASGVTGGGSAANGAEAAPDEPRKVHGEVDVAVGSGGYRSGYVRSDFPVGKTGTLSIAVGDTRFNGRSGYGGYGGYGGPYASYGGGPYERQSVALGLALGGASLGSSDRCRSDWGYAHHRIDPVGADGVGPCQPVEDDRAPLPDLPPQ